MNELEQKAVPLSQMVRPDCEVSKWVYDLIVKQEKESLEALQLKQKEVDELQELYDNQYEGYNSTFHELQAQLKESEERCERLRKDAALYRSCVKGALPLIKELPENQWGLGTDGEGTWPIVIEVIHRFEQALSTDANKGEI